MHCIRRLFIHLHNNSFILKDGEVMILMRALIMMMIMLMMMMSMMMSMAVAVVVMMTQGTYVRTYMLYV